MILQRLHLTQVRISLTHSSAHLTGIIRVHAAGGTGGVSTAHRDPEARRTVGSVVFTP
jgi:hypothetical protein